MINGIHHTAVSTGNLDRMVAFYCNVLGFRQVQQMSWPRGSELVDRIVGLKDSEARQVMLRVGNCFVEMFEYANPPPKPGEPNRPVCDHGYTHICLDVTDIQAEYERLMRAGMRFHTAPHFNTDLELATTYGRDPDGNVIEIQELLSPGNVLRA